MQEDSGYLETQPPSKWRTKGEIEKQIAGKWQAQKY